MKTRFLLSAIAALSLIGCIQDTEETVYAPEAKTEDSEAPSPVIPAIPADSVTIVQAGFTADSPTKSRLDINKADTEATVLWTKGDSFTTVFNYNYDTHTYYKARFTTEEDGVEEATFSTEDYCEGTKFYSLYPELEGIGLYNGNLIFGINIPVTQTAIPGGIAEGLNKAIAYSETLDEDIEFYNIPALVRFRLSGSLASQISSITFTATADIAGDFVVSIGDSGPVFVNNVYFKKDATSSSIVLSGNFVAGQDYFIALKPCQVSSFSMVFSDENGNFITKISSKNTTFTSSRIKDFGTITIGDEFSTPVIPYMKHTQGSNPVTIAVIPDGFTADELDQYEQLAKSGIDALFATEPFKSYKDYFNVYILKVASSESGANITDGNGNIITARGCYFGSKWGDKSYDDMRANDDKVFLFVSSNCPDIMDGTHTINEVPILMIINDARYGGKCWAWESGKSYCMVPYSYNGGEISWEYPELLPSSNTESSGFHTRTADELAEVGGTNYGNWTNTLAHEFGGHCFSRLADEYWYKAVAAQSPTITGQTWTVPFSLNVSGSYINNNLPWKELINNRDNLIKKDSRYERIGTYQGGDVCMFGRWRSEKISCMIDNRFYFSAWQRYLIVKRIFVLAGDAEKFNYDSWLAKDVTTDPVRDQISSNTLGTYNLSEVHHGGYLPPPSLIEEQPPHLWISVR